MASPKAQPGTDEILERALDRSVRIEMHRATDWLVLPVASARLIKADDDSIWLDEPQIIGKTITLSNNSTCECYFVMDDEIYGFKAKVQDLDASFALNESKMIRGIKLKRPTDIIDRQRRQNFRTLLVTEDDIKVTVHSAGTGETPDIVPLDRINDQGMLLDASAAGIGVRVDRPIRKGELEIFDKLFVQFVVPGDPREVAMLTEVRQIRRVLEDTATRLGLMALPWPTNSHLSRTTAPLERYLMQVQRKSRAA